jgi:5-methyltetrahydrofolate--homocysteine methyltransferase
LTPQEGVVSQIEAIYNAVLDGNAPAAKAGVEKALAEGTAPDVILKDGLIAAMQNGLALLKPYLADSGAKPTGKVIIGTVKGDLHDIGKNLVAMMLEGAGFEVVDLGTDVTPEKFVKAALEHKPQVVGMSALLTTTMPSMSGTVKALVEAGVRDQVKVMIGGAPVTDAFAKQIGADGYAPDASSAVRMAKSLSGAA